MRRDSTTRCEIEIDAPPEAVFDLIHDYPRRLEWDPFLREARLLDADEAGVGATARCVAKLASGGLGMDVRYVAFDRPRVAAIEMVRGPWPLRTFAASLRHDPFDGGRRSRVVYAFHFTVGPAWLDALVRPVFARFFARETRGRLAALRGRFAA